MRIAVDLIDRGERLRATCPEQVQALAESIAACGLLSPITVYKRQVVRAGIAVDGYGLIAGLHRLEAVQRLGLVEIDAHVVGLPELQRQLAECDENLCGTKLTPSERALFTRRRKEIYEALHPETRHGNNQHTRSGQVGHSSQRFTADTAARTNQSERVVRRDATRGERIDAEVLEELRGTDLDTGVVLDRLARAPDAAAELARLKELARDADAAEARRRNREADQLIAEQRLAAAVEWLAGRLDVNELHQLGEMLAGVAPPLSKALMREAA